MLSTDSIIEKIGFDYWFTRIDRSRFIIHAMADGKVDDTSIGQLTEINSQNSKIELVSDITDENIKKLISEDFEAYRDYRPEYMVGKYIDDAWLNYTNPTNDILLNLKEVYKSIIMGIQYMKYDDVKAAQMCERTISWLDSTDFFTAPASTIYHDSEQGGLLKHTLKVVNRMIELLTISVLSNVSLVDAITTAMVHDWCKIDFYESYMKNVKNEDTGVWEKVQAYRHKSPNLPFGHGVTSLFIAQKFFKLSVEQSLAIRWHMGEYNVADSEKYDLMEANERFPSVQLLQLADRLALL